MQLLHLKKVSLQLPESQVIRLMFTHTSLFVWLNEQRNVMRKQRNWEKQLAAKKSKRKEEKQRRKLNREQEAGTHDVIWSDDTIYYSVWLVCRPSVFYIFALQKRVTQILSILSGSWKKLPKSV